jgi:hypothetical protein
MALGDGIRRNIAYVDPTERAQLRDAFIALNQQLFPGNRADPTPGGVSWWFKQDEIHQATHVHGGPEFLPWHRELVNRLEQMLRAINPQLSLHYWDWTQDPRAIPNANLGGGMTGTLNLFTPAFMGYGGSVPNDIGEPWLSAGYYVPGANPHRDLLSGTAADPPVRVTRNVFGNPASAMDDASIVSAADYALMRARLELVHNRMHAFINMGSQHFSFRDPFVFLLHSDVDRLFALWQTDPAHPERLDPNYVYGSESNLNVPVGAVIQNVNNNIEPWSTGHAFDAFGMPHFTRPWSAPENQGAPKTYKHLTVVTPPRYDTNAPPAGYEVAFQANTTDLWTVGEDPHGDWRLGMMPGTSPSIAALPGGGYVVAFQANTGNLWTIGADNHGDWRLGMMPGTSPSITVLPGGGYEVAFQANTTNLWTVGADNHGDWGLGMMMGTSPNITALPGGGYEVAFQANTTNLWTVGADNHGDWGLGMMAGTSPSIVAMPGGGYEVAFQANTTTLWTVGADNHGDWGLGMMIGTSPSMLGVAVVV